VWMRCIWDVVERRRKAFLPPHKSLPLPPNNNLDFIPHSRSQPRHTLDRQLVTRGKRSHPVRGWLPPGVDVRLREAPLERQRFRTEAASRGRMKRDRMIEKDSVGRTRIMYREFDTSDYLELHRPHLGSPPLLNNNDSPDLCAPVILHTLLHSPTLCLRTKYNTKALGGKLEGAGELRSRRRTARERLFSRMRTRRICWCGLDWVRRALLLAWCGWGWMGTLVFGRVCAQLVNVGRRMSGHRLVCPALSTLRRGRSRGKGRERKGPSQQRGFIDGYWDGPAVTGRCTTRQAFLIDFVSAPFILTSTVCKTTE